MKKPTRANKRIGSTQDGKTRASNATLSRGVAKPDPVRADGVRSGTKIAKVVALLRGPKGATIRTLQKGTGWQAHSVRGALAGAIKKKLGFSVVSEMGAVRTYRIVP